MNIGILEVMKAKFRQSFRGYNEQEVDEFLDIVTKDYKALYDEIDRLKEEIEDLKKGYR